MAVSKKVAISLRPETPVEKVGFEDAKRVLSVVNCGLTDGVGVAIPGQMCVEAAVCYALGMDHGDEPVCVDEELRNFKIQLNDGYGWNGEKGRADGLRRLAIAQLGTNKKFNFGKFDKVFRRKLRELISIRIAALIVETEENLKSGMVQMRKDLKTWINKPYEVDLSLPEVDYDLRDAASTLYDWSEQDYEGMFNDITDDLLGDLTAQEFLSQVSELAIEAIEESNPKLESLVWMNKLTKKPKF
jgi:hypothetical protein